MKYRHFIPADGIFHRQISAWFPVEHGVVWTNLVGQPPALLRRKFENELPPILSGLDATGIREECRKAIDEVLSVLHAG